MIPGRSIKRMLQLRYTVHRIRIGGTSGCRASAELAQGSTNDEGIVKGSRWDHRSTGNGMDRRTGRVNWGPSAASGSVPQSEGIIHKPFDGRQRRRCGHTKRGSDRTIQPVGEPRATGLVVVVRRLRCRLDASPITEQTPKPEIPTVVAYKQACPRLRRWPLREAGLKPYWGKPTVRNFRGGGGNEVEGLVTVCHEARRG